MLGQREHSQQELVRKLTGKGYPGDLVAVVMEALQANGWQDDQRFAESYTRTRIQKGYGPVYINNALRERGVAISTVELDAIVSGLYEDWDALIDQVYFRKYQGQQPESSRESQKRWRFLQQRGFTTQQIQALFKREPIENR